QTLVTYTTYFRSVHHFVGRIAALQEAVHPTGCAPDRHEHGAGERESECSAIGRGDGVELVLEQLPHILWNGREPGPDLVGEVVRVGDHPENTDCGEQGGKQGQERTERHPGREQGDLALLDFLPDPCGDDMCSGHEGAGGLPREYARCAVRSSVSFPCFHQPTPPALVPDRTPLWVMDRQEPRDPARVSPSGEADGDRWGLSF